MTRTRKTLVGAVVATAAIAGGLALYPSPAQAWPTPDTTVTGGACLGSGERTPVTWKITNRETGFPGSPAYIVNPEVTPNFPTTEFSPQPLANTGFNSALARTTVPPSFEGVVELKYVMVWRGTDGHDKRAGYGRVKVKRCPPPPTTTTTTAPTTTTTTTTTVPVPTTVVTRPPVTVTVPPVTVPPVVVTVPVPVPTPPVVVEVPERRVAQAVPVIVERVPFTG